MIEVVIPKEVTLFDEETSRFYRIQPQTLTLEHSLLSVSKWESKWKIPFLGNEKKYPKTRDMWIDYYRCMIIGKKVDPRVAYAFTADDMNRINAYINDPMTATKFYNWNSRSGGSSRPVDVTSERLYMWMTKLNIPIELCEKWHLNRLLTLIKLCNVENEEPHKLTASEIQMLNKQRKMKYHTKG